MTHNALITALQARAELYRQNGDNYFHYGARDAEVDAAILEVLSASPTGRDLDTLLCTTTTAADTRQAEIVAWLLDPTQWQASYVGLLSRQVIVKAIERGEARPQVKL